ncbi:MAG: hypothetical protein M3365_04300 [Gemmatimonadota bacterium]|nr:hypothetical protein [Gemmatimonadota bacterium]
MPLLRFLESPRQPLDFGFPANERRARERYGRSARRGIENALAEKGGRQPDIGVPTNLSEIIVEDRHRLALLASHRGSLGEREDGALIERIQSQDVAGNRLDRRPVGASTLKPQTDQQGA